MGSYRTYSIPGKTAALVIEFTVEDLSSAELQSKFLRLQWKTCPWAEHFDDDDDDDIWIEDAEGWGVTLNFTELLTGQWYFKFVSNDTDIAGRMRTWRFERKNS